VGGCREDRDNPEEAVQQLDGDQQEVGRCRGDRDNPEEAGQQLDGDQQENVLVLLVVPNLVGPALLGEIEEKRALVEGGTEPTDGIAPEKTLGGTTGGSGQSRAQLG